MVWKKVLFIFNPVAGKSQIKNYLLEIVQVLSEADFKVLCYPTRGRGDARRLVRERKDDYLYVVCAGGDGTLDEVVSGMMENPVKPFVPIGYIPAGTTNDFASSLQIPSDMVQAAKIVAEGRTFRCDLGRFNGKDYFTYIAAFGLFTGTSYQTPQELKNQLGHFAYILQGMTELGQMRAYHMHVRAYLPESGAADAQEGGKEAAAGTEDTAAKKENGTADLLEGGKDPEAGDGRKDVKEAAEDVIDLDGEFAYGMITNSFSIGGFPNITGKRVDLQDGLFEVTLVRMPQNPLDLSEILLAIGNPDIESRMVVTFKASRVKVVCDEKVAWTRDGEYAGTHKEVVVENCPQQLRILVPEERLAQDARFPVTV